MRQLLTIAAVLTVFGYLFFFAPNAISCHARWSGSGYEVSYGTFAGCQVRVGDRWLPEDAVRQVGK